MVDMTAKLFECDRDEMYCYILRLCSKSLPRFHLCVCFSIVTGMTSYLLCSTRVCICACVCVKETVNGIHQRLERKKTWCDCCSGVQRR